MGPARSGTGDDSNCLYWTAAIALRSTEGAIDVDAGRRIGARQLLARRATVDRVRHGSWRLSSPIWLGLRPPTPSRATPVRRGPAWLVGGYRRVSRSPDGNRGRRTT